MISASALIFIIATIYLIYSAYVLYAFLGLKTPKIKDNHQTQNPDISIVIVAKDEEQNLPACLESLNHLDYPKDKLEIILVNDRSIDFTGDLMQSFRQTWNCSKYIEISKPSAQLTGKSNALIQGISQSSGDLLFFTDADCVVPPSWIKSIVKWFNQGYNLVGGSLILDYPNESPSIFSKIQTLDWLYFTLLGSTWTNLGLPVSIWGNNFAIRKSTYLNSGGFEKAGSHILEDFALLQQVTQNKSNKTILTIDNTSAIKTKPASNWKEFYHQRKRWVIGARSHNWKFQLLAILTGLFYTSLFIACILGFIKLFIIGLLIMLITDLTFLLIGCKKLNKLNLLKYYPLYKGFNLFYITVFIPVYLFSKSANWKGQTYTN